MFTPNATEGAFDVEQRRYQCWKVLFDLAQEQRRVEVVGLWLAAEQTQGRPPIQARASRHPEPLPQQAHRVTEGPFRLAQIGPHPNHYPRKSWRPIPEHEGR